LHSHKEQAIFIGDLKPNSPKKCQCGQACHKLFINENDKDLHEKSFRRVIINPNIKDDLPDQLRAQKYLSESLDRKPREYTWIAKILSNGVGQDSTTEIALNHAFYDEIVFADTGSEQPETYEYLKYLQNRLPSVARHKIRIVHSRYGIIYDYYKRVEKIPMVYARRDCTAKFKIEPIKRVYRKLYGINAHHDVRNLVPDDYNGDPARINNTGKKYFHRIEMSLGINLTENERARGSAIWYVKNMYPLIEKEVERKDEKGILTALDWKIPIKSGCFFCPYGKSAYWKRLKKLHPNLYKDSVALQDNAMAAKKNPLRKKFIFFDDKPSKDKFNPESCGCFSGDWDAEDDDGELDTKTSW